MDQQNNSSFEQETQQPNFDFMPEEPKEHDGKKFVVAGVAIIVIIIAFFGGYRISQRISSTATSTDFLAVETATTTELEETTDQTASLLGAAGIGKGEVVFNATVADGTEKVVREIYLHNPYKDNWILAYDGYKTVNSGKIEITKGTFAAITYDKIRIRTLDAETELFGPRVSVKANDTTSVDISL